MARVRDVRVRRVFEQASPDDGQPVGTKDAAHSQAAVLAELLRAGATTDGAQAEADRPGDPACWLKRVCPSCGSIADADPPTTCPSCRAAIPAQ
jgi:rubrerythrin